jgi:histone H3/H4
MLLNRSKIKEIAGNMHVTKEFVDSLEEHTKQLLQRACQRARENNRNTLMERDV